MIEIGDSLQELRIKHSGKIYLLWGNKWIDVLDNNGNLNIRIKNLINRGTPSSSSSNGFYYNGDNIYLKLDSDIINMSSLSSSSLPEGSVIMYEGDSPPEGWYLYDVPTGVNGTIYIVNIETEPYTEKVESFDTILGKFNDLDLYIPLIENEGITLPIYNYLNRMYKYAELEYEGNSNLFKSSTYLEVYNYRGNNNQYEIDGTAQNAMLYWLMAMCLSELVYTLGNDNNQTKLFKFAYDIGKETGYGRKIRLYNNYTLKGDPYVCRLVASAIYSKNRPSYANSIQGFRSILGANNISDVTVTDPTDLWMKNLRIERNNPSEGNSVINLGYGVNLDEIFPSPAGPYLSLYSNRVHPSLLLDLSDIDDFNFDSNPDYYQNYDIDVLIYEKVVANYSIESNLNLKRSVLAIADDEQQDSKYLLLNKVYYTYNSYNPLDSFKEVSIGNDYFEGTFNENVTGRDLSGYINDPRITNLLYLVRNAGEENRHTTLDPLYGRRRPCLGTTDPSSKLFGNNYMYDISIEKMFGKSAMYDQSALVYYIDRNENNVYDGFTSEGSKYLVPMFANSYPSGHSAGIWAIAMIMMELFPNKYDKIYKAAYDFTISRLIVRAHWNSDIMYGKLSSTTIFPILHAMQNFNSTFQSATEALNGTPVDPFSDFYIKITNNTSYDAYITEEFKFSDNSSRGSCYVNTLGFIEGHYRVIPPGESIRYESSLLDMGAWSSHIGNTFVNAVVNLLNLNTPVIVYAYCPSCENTHNSLVYLATITNGQTSIGNAGYEISLTNGSNFNSRYLLTSTKVVIDNATGSDAYITGEIYFFVDNPPNHDGYFMTYTSDAILNGITGYYGVVRIPPGKTSFDLLAIEMSDGDTVAYGQTLIQNYDAPNNITEDKVRVYGVNSNNTAKHDRTIFSCSLDKTKTTFDENSIYNITLIAGKNHSQMWTGPNNNNDLGLSSNSINVTHIGGQNIISVTSTSLFTASSNLSWCTVTVSGNSLIINISSYNSENDRTAIITVSNTSLSKSIVVTLAGDPGNSTLLYKVGLMSDIHFCFEGSTTNNAYIKTKSDGNDNSSGLLSLYDKDLLHLLQDPFSDVAFNASPGDISTYNINDFIHFTKKYKDYYGNNNVKPFYCSTGNHDHGLIYCTNNKRVSVEGNIPSLGSIWVSDGTTLTSIGNADGERWNNITYNGTTYDCPGSLATGTIISFGSEGNGSYFIEQNGDLYVFLMVDYGSLYGDDYQSLVLPHHLLNLSNRYVLKIMQDCGKTTIFSGNESNFNFLYYNPYDLAYLGELIMLNSNKRIFVFSHHFFTNKAGYDKHYHPGGSTCLMGLTLHYLNWLNDNNTNVIWFTGHSHYSWKDSSPNILRWTNEKFGVITPNSTTYSNAIAYNQSEIGSSITSTSHYYFNMWNIKQYLNRNVSDTSDNMYYRINPDSNAEKGGWNIHLPSMSRPALDDSTNNLNDVEAAIMKVYNNKVEIEKIGYSTSDNGLTYTSYSISDSKLTINIVSDSSSTIIPLLSVNSNCNEQPELNKIKFVIINGTNKNALFTGRLKLFANKTLNLTANSSGSDEIAFFFRPLTDSTGNGDHLEWYTNTEKLEPGEKVVLTFSGITSCPSGEDNYGNINPVGISSTLTNKFITSGLYYFVNEDSTVWTNGSIKYSEQISSLYPQCPQGSPAIKLLTGIIKVQNNNEKNGTYLCHLKFNSGLNLKIGMNRVYYITIDNIFESYYDSNGQLKYLTSALTSSSGSVSSNVATVCY